MGAREVPGALPGIRDLREDPRPVAVAPGMIPGRFLPEHPDPPAVSEHAVLRHAPPQHPPPVPVLERREERPLEARRRLPVLRPAGEEYPGALPVDRPGMVR